MGERVHVGTLIWGLVLTIWGLVLLGVGLDWWQLDLIDLRYVGPALIIVIGAIVLFSAMRTREDERR